MTKLILALFTILAFTSLANGCSPATDTEGDGLAVGSGSSDTGPQGVTPGGAPGSGEGGLGGIGGPSDGGALATDARTSPSADAARGNATSDAGATQGTTEDAAASEGGALDGSLSPGGDGGAAGATCALPSTFKWTGGGPLAQPKNGWLSMKDFTHVIHNGQHIVYYTTFQNNWGSGMMTFKDWPDAASAAQTPTSFGVAPTLFYFKPKSIWVLAYQWGPHKFSFRTSSDPANASGWSAEKSLYNTALPPSGTGPIDQTVICDSSKCYLYYAGDNGHIYKSSMPIASFPGEFPAAQDSGIVGTAQNLFEGVQVYRIQGADKYLMIVEAQGSARYYRAWTATGLEGPWTLLSNDFAVKKNVTLAPDWTNDISHGDIVRSNPDETFTIDPCKLQFVFQGRDPTINTDYGRLPYRLGLITLQR